jgi:hypothetical protein
MLMILLVWVLSGPALYGSRIAEANGRIPDCEILRTPLS